MVFHIWADPCHSTQKSKTQKTSQMAKKFWPSACQNSTRSSRVLHWSTRGPIRPPDFSLTFPEVFVFSRSFSLEAKELSDDPTKHSGGKSHRVLFFRKVNEWYLQLEILQDFRDTIRENLSNASAVSAGRLHSCRLTKRSFLGPQAICQQFLWNAKM